MSDSQTIDMVKCPYCGDTWVREDTELVCQTCIPALSVDLAAADIAKAVNELKSADPEHIRKRIDILISEYQALGKVIQKAKPKKDK